MSKKIIEKFVTSNKAPTNKLFRKRARYNSYTRKKANGNQHLTSFQLGEKMFYGRVTPLYQVPVSLVDTSRLYTIADSQDPIGNPINVMEFVGRQFELMKREFQLAALSNKLADDDYISKMIAYRGFESPIIKYNEYKNIFFEKIAQRFKRLNYEFLNITEFMTTLEEYLKPRVSEAPFTYPSFVKSRFNDIMSTGLAIEIADLKYSNDVDKAKHFYESPNWKIYMNACNNHGFIIDQHYPWRLIADIDSSVMRAQSQRMGLFYGKTLLYFSYDVAGKTYLKMFLQDMLQLYNMCRSPTILREQPCDNNSTRTVLLQPTVYKKPTDLLQEISFRDALKFYMSLRISEQKPNMNEIDRHNLIKDALALHDSASSVFPMYLFEAIVSSTVDKIGSHVYYKEQIKIFLEQRKDVQLEFNEHDNQRNRTMIREDGSGPPVYLEGPGSQSTRDLSPFDIYRAKNEVSEVSMTNVVGGSSSGGGY